MFPVFRVRSWLAPDSGPAQMARSALSRMHPHLVGLCFVRTSCPYDVPLPSSRLPACFLFSQAHFPVPGLCDILLLSDLDAKASVEYANVPEAQALQEKSLEGTDDFHENRVLFVAFSFFLFLFFFLF